ncbi:hypothetical protein BJ165DRAFT_1581089 [Panaeolus papilionaceus]|nr:hypothetical protein BJ165DRAFT_1581089 [Panaeolus papilionaceus]
MSTAGTTQPYEHLKAIGPLSVVTVTPEDVKNRYLWVYILMGPTGSGKSAFIEALSPHQSLSISKDTLESVTQSVTSYRVVNLFNKVGYNYILMDTPGFLDTKLSESRITTMIAENLQCLRQSVADLYVFILYFQPITDIRISGSKQRAVKLLRAFAQSFQATGITVVTTMWNHISTTKQIEDTNIRFNSLKDEIFTSSDKLSIYVTKFEFSKNSALSILDTLFGGWTHAQDKSQNVNREYQSLILTNLLDRITNAQQRLQTLSEDRMAATAPGYEDVDLLEVVLRDEGVVLTMLQSFLDDIIAIGPAGLVTLESLLDTRYDADPSASSTPWSQAVIVQTSNILLPGETHASPTQSSLRPAPSPNQSSLSFSSHIKDIVSPLKRVFKR